MRPADDVSKSHINKCGRLLREYVAGNADHLTPDEVTHALEVVQAFREAHGYPMTKVRLGVTSMVRTEGLDAAVSQRHKRVPRIIRKLQRMQGTSLARLEDIGGCRVVVYGAEELDRLAKRIRKNWGGQFARDPRDYINSPKDIGYRALHFVVRRDGRAIEVQVRTQGQQQWADAVEAIDSRLGLNLKDGSGPEPLLTYFSLAGQAIHASEYDGYIPEQVRVPFETARQAVIDQGYYSG